MSTRRICFDISDNNADVVVRRSVASPCTGRTVSRFFRPYAIPEDVAEKIRSSKKQPRNKVDGSFAVLLDEPTVYLEELVKEAQKRGLTVSGDETARTTGGSIINAGYGDIVTFGTSTRFDVNWIKRSQYACERSIIPIHKISDWDTVTKALKAFAKEKNKLQDELYYYNTDGLAFKALKEASRKRMYARVDECTCKPKRIYEVEDCRGIRARLHDDFIKVGYNFYKVEKPICEERRDYLFLL